MTITEAEIQQSADFSPYLSALISMQRKRDNQQEQEQNRNQFRSPSDSSLPGKHYGTLQEVQVKTCLPCSIQLWNDLVC